MSLNSQPLDLDELSRPRRWIRRAVLLLTLVGAVGIGVSIWQLQSGAAAEPTADGVVARRGDVVLSVGGVGRIVEARAPGQINVGSGGSGSGSGSLVSASTGGGSAPANALFPNTAGLVARVLVAPGQEVTRGQAIAVLEDSGAATAALRQAEVDLASARLELRQKQVSDPAKGVPPTAAELTAGRLAIASARARLSQLLGPSRPADISLARADLRRAEAEFETLRGGTAAARRKALAIALETARLARQRLSQILAPPSPADVAAAEADVRKAEAELAVLLRQPESPLPEAIAAAETAVKLAQQKLAKLTGPKDPADVRAAEAEVRKAEAELANLLRRADPPV